MIGPLDAQTDMMVSTLQALRRQEESGYQSHDYLHQQAQSPPVVRGPLQNENPSAVDIDCRFRMTEWCYQIVDYCKFQRDTVAIAMSFVDRALSTPAGQVIVNDRNLFQLAAMTSLYTAVKIHEPEAIEPSLIASLSRGAFTTEQVEQMEMKLLAALQWRVNPATALFFVQQFLDLVPAHLLNDELRTTVFEVAKFQTELAVCDYELSTVNASSIAFAALLNALESLVGSNSLHLQVANQLEVTLAQAALIDSRSSQLTAIRIRLYEAIQRNRAPDQEPRSCSLAPQQTCASEILESTKAASNGACSSPRSVSATTSAL